MRARSLAFQVVLDEFSSSAKRRVKPNMLTSTVVLKKAVIWTAILRGYESVLTTVIGAGVQVKPSGQLLDSRKLRLRYAAVLGIKVSARATARWCKELTIRR